MIRDREKRLAAKRKDYYANKERYDRSRRARYRAHRERELANKHQFHMVHRERILSERRARYRATQGRSSFAAWIRKQYGITLTDYETLSARQGGVCAICGHPPNGRRLAVDHSHLSGRVRGLLCGDCNRAIGLLKDNPESARRLASYLEGVAQ